MMDGDIELEIGAGPGPGNYAVRVLRAAAGGEPVGTLRLDVEEILSRRSLLEATVLASSVARRSVPAAEQPVRETGLQLFHALFNGAVYGMYRASLGVTQQQGRRLRVVLRLTAPELAALPWEMLFDPETETYLCRREPLVRHVHAPYTADPLKVHPPLRVLGLVASPRGLQPLDVDAEKDHLTQALAGPVAEGLIELIWAPETTWHGVHTQLLAGQWHVLHFVGHGDYDIGTDQGVLALVGADGRADLVEADRLADLLGEAQPTPRLVVLNSCSSGQTGVNNLFSGTAAVLVRSGIGAVAAMQFAISDTAAIAFARGFYTAIAHGRSIEDAARSGRISILGTRRSLEWVTPVLYVRGQATQLFTLTQPPDVGRETLPGHQGMMKILFLGASPRGAPSLRIDQEIREIQQEIRHGRERDRIQVEIRLAIRARDVSQALLDSEPDVVHFVGFGKGGEESFAAGDESENAIVVPVAGLAALFETVGKNVRCVIVNASITQQLARDLAAALPRAYVIGIRQPVGDRLAIRFSIGFYQALASGRSVEQAFRLGQAQLKMAPESDAEPLEPLLLHGDQVIEGGP